MRPRLNSTYRRENERGASLVEMGLMVALIAVVCIAAVTQLGKNASSKFSNVGSAIGEGEAGSAMPDFGGPCTGDNTRYFDFQMVGGGFRSWDAATNSSAQCGSSSYAVPTLPATPSNCTSLAQPGESIGYYHPGTWRIFYANGVPRAAC